MAIFTWQVNGVSQKFIASLSTIYRHANMKFDFFNFLELATTL